MADVNSIKSSEVPVYGIFGTGNIKGLGTVVNTENAKFDKVASLANAGSNEQNDAQKLFDPHGIFVSV